MGNTSISVIITTFNRAHFVEESLNSILNQTRRPDEVIVVNDGSTDNTREVLRSYGRQILYLEKENGGLASALNLGLEHARMDYVYILDDDDAACPETLAIHAAALDANPDCGFTYSPSYRGKTGADGRIVADGVVSLPEVPEEEFLLRLYQGCFLTTPGMLTRRSCYDSVGPYDVKLKRCEDYDRKIRLARRFRPLYIDTPSFFRRVHDEPRGGGTIANFSMRDFDTIALKYEQPIFERFREELYLSEYLPCLPADARSNDLEGMERREALLSRMAVMGLHGIWRGVAADLAIIGSNAECKDALTERERALCWLAVSEPAAVSLLLDDFDALRRVRELTKVGINRQIRWELARGIFYMLTKYRRGIDTGMRIRKIGYGDVVKFGLFFIWLMGKKGGRAELLRRIRQRAGNG